MPGSEWIRSKSCSGGQCAEVKFVPASACSSGACVEVGYAKSSYCSDAACVEVGFATSSFCGTQNCVEVGHTPGRVLLRDGKLGDASPVIAFSPADWRAFLELAPTVG